MHDGYTYIHHMKQKQVPTIYGFIILWFVLLFVLVALVQQQQTQAQSTQPDAPSGLTATAGNTRVFLKWNAVSGATRYDYRHAATELGVDSATWISAGTATDVLVAGLTNNAVRYFQVQVTTTSTSMPSGKVSTTPALSDCGGQTTGPSKHTPVSYTHLTLPTILLV